MEVIASPASETVLGGFLKQLFLGVLDALELDLHVGEELGDDAVDAYILLEGLLVVGAALLGCLAAHAHRHFQKYF